MENFHLDSADLLSYLLPLTDLPHPTLGSAEYLHGDLPGAEALQGFDTGDYWNVESASSSAPCTPESVQLPELTIRAEPSVYQITQHKIFPDVELDFSRPFPCHASMHARLIRLSAPAPADPFASGRSSSKRARVPSGEEAIDTGFDVAEFHSPDELIVAGSTGVAFRKLFLRTIADIKGPHSKVHLGFKDLFLIEIVTRCDDARWGTLPAFRTGSFEILSHSKQLPANLAELHHVYRPRKYKSQHRSPRPSHRPNSAGAAGAGLASASLKHEPFDVLLPPPGHPGSPDPGSPVGLSLSASPPLDRSCQVEVGIKGPPVVHLGTFELPHAEATFADLRQLLLSCNMPGNFRFWHAVFEGQIRPAKEATLKVLPSAADDNFSVWLVYEDLLSLWPNDQFVIKLDNLVHLVSTIHGHALTADDARWVAVGLTDFFLNKGSSPTDIKREDFRLFLAVFGGIEHCLKKLVDLYSSPVFHGFLRAEAADELLRGHPGHFLFRFSERYFLEGSLAFHVNRRKPSGASHDSIERIETFGLFYKHKQATYALRHADPDGIVSTVREFMRKFAKKLGQPLLNSRILPADMKWKYHDPDGFLKEVPSPYETTALF
eukprot:TRINITY_DN6104_c0_g1_i1.p1 TRINITY_DN6104_c0_g1~~TRINITY_DN6104_c0_g1_i1.p1  ORF type:complete len:605 (-),score=214.88 TRINITY_DN6104_c0_g1_i1:930-2744(-)